MNRLFGCILLASAALTAQSVQSTLLALKDSHTPRKVLSNQLVNEMMALAKSDQSPSRAGGATILRGSDHRARRQGHDDNSRDGDAESHFRRPERQGIDDLPANRLYETLAGFGIEDRTVQAIVGRFTDIGQEVRGPDDIARSSAFRLQVILPRV